MGSSFKSMIYNLQRACNIKYNSRLLIDHTQFYSEDAKKPITIYRIKTAIPRQEKENGRFGKLKHVELFSSASQLDIVYFLRDYYYELSKQRIPESKANDEWQKRKQKYMSKS